MVRVVLKNEVHLREASSTLNRITPNATQLLGFDLKDLGVGSSHLPGRVTSRAGCLVEGSSPPASVLREEATSPRQDGQPGPLLKEHS